MTTAEPNHRSLPEGRQPGPADLSWMLWTALGIGGIWVAVLLVSFSHPISSPVPSTSTFRWPRSRPGSGVGLAASTAPVAAAMLTAIAGVVSNVFRQGAGGG